MPDRKDKLLQGDLLALHAYLEVLETRIHTLEKNQSDPKGNMATQCLAAVADRYTFVSLLDLDSPPESRDYALEQLRRLARTFCRQYNLDVPDWAKASNDDG